MIASFTRFMLVLQLVGIAGLALLQIKLQWVSSAVVALCIGAMLVTLPRSLIIWNNFFLSGAFRQPDQAGKPIGLIGKTMLFLQEFYWSSLCWLWTMPFKAFTSRTLAQSAAMPVLLIHGYGANSGFWHHTSARFMREGISHMAIELEPLLVSIDDYAGIIHGGIEKLCSVHRSEKVILLAHSMGGLAARAYVRKFGTERVARIITLGTPHYGSKLASYAIGINAMQMRWTAETAAPGWLTNLEKRNQTLPGN